MDLEVTPEDEIDDDSDEKRESDDFDFEAELRDFIDELESRDPDDIAILGIVCVDTPQADPDTDARTGFCGRITNPNLEAYGETGAVISSIGNFNQNLHEIGIDVGMEDTKGAPGDSLLGALVCGEGLE